jgi:hypothetical protein
MTCEEKRRLLEHGDRLIEEMRRQMEAIVRARAVSH